MLIVVQFWGDRWTFERAGWYLPQMVSILYGGGPGGLTDAAAVARDAGRPARYCPPRHRHALSILFT
jgi:hypothetical protein